ncbi:hypothetical protein GK047_23605 [Paenibacillus sp. SYP-B3998]|uniref:Uncharacterized protein n=1 Tax=Paenibacillus sp. SYP-B3998 TaxID=2678564 RepID=A0A6G4A4W5_9BACL|nr:hypothetical protein [Paenibacillus sp. SYP-B3998]NEW08984.1 hypothetical protein [Paenibacillus sp. SYP-B3998]
MNDELQRTLSEILESGSQSNPAVNVLISDYAKYHAVLVIVGGCLVLLFALLSIIFWTKFKRSPKISKLKWGFERKAYFSFGLLSSSVALLMILIVVANLTNVLNPLHGFSLLNVSFKISNGATYKDELRYAFNEWIQSGNENIPSILQEKINKRIEFHTTKAIVCGILLILFVGLSVYIWNALVKRAKSNDSKWRFKEKAYFVFGIATVVLSLLMMVIVVANMQGAFAPITLFMMNLFNS